MYMENYVTGAKTQQNKHVVCYCFVITIIVIIIMLIFFLDIPLIVMVFSKYVSQREFRAQTLSH